MHFFSGRAGCGILFIFMLWYGTTALSAGKFGTSFSIAHVSNCPDSCYGDNPVQPDKISISQESYG
jgi:hypothetical protein